MEVKQKLYIVDKNGEKFLGIGVLWLLKAIGESGSIRQAASALKLSYTKALRMLNRLEEHVEYPVITRQHGGESRQGAALTPFGEMLIEQYTAFQKRVKSDTEESFRDFRVALERWEDRDAGTDA